jgi:hypothetical protein
MVALAAPARAIRSSTATSVSAVMLTTHSRGAGLGDLVIADDPAEPASGDQHDPGPVVEVELRRLGDTVIGGLADGIEAEGIPVELARRLPPRSAGSLADAPVEAPPG